MSTEASYPNPTEADLKDPAFNAIWEAIKGWDLSRGPGRQGHMYSGATGNDVMHVLLALRAAEQACAVPAPAGAMAVLSETLDKLEDGDAEGAIKTLRKALAAEADKAQAAPAVEAWGDVLEVGDAPNGTIEVTIG